MSNKHFKLRKDLSIDWFELTLFRIEATKDIERFGVKAGEIGGFIEKEENLYGNAWVSGNARVFGDARVSGNAYVYGKAYVYGDKLQSAIDCRNITNEKYNITILPNSLQIGCQCHSQKKWWDFSDREIIEMGGKDGLNWWKKWKPILKAICEFEK